MGDGGLDLLRRDGKIILVFERGADQRASATLLALFMGGMVAMLVYASVYAILHADPARSALVVPFLVACAGLAIWNAADSMLEPDYTTVFDNAARTVTLTESGFSTRRRGPVSFDAIAALDTRVGYAARRRSVIVWLKLKNGEEWRLGYDAIWVRPATASQFRPLVAKLRGELGLGGEDID